jgi:polyhydroxybutyrate depolymerase
MSFALGVKLSDRIAAIAPVAGLLYIHEVLKNPVSLVLIVGTKDTPPVKKISLVKTVFAQAYVSNPAKAWRDYLSCSDEPKVQTEAGVTVVKYGSCRDGTEVATYTVEGMGHVFPGKADLFEGDLKTGNKINAVDTAWDFFTNHPKL